MTLTPEAVAAVDQSSRNDPIYQQQLQWLYDEWQRWCESHPVVVDTDGMRPLNQLIRSIVAAVVAAGGGVDCHRCCHYPNIRRLNWWRAEAVELQVDQSTVDLHSIVDRLPK